MKKTEEFIENRILWRAERQGLPSKSVLLFKDLSDEERSKYTSQISNLDSGEIILLFVAKKKNWTAIGTKMVIGCDGQHISAVKFKEIKDLDSKKMKDLPDEPKWFTRIPRKLSENKLVITDNADQEFTFQTKKGNDLLSLWRILLMLSRFDHS